MLPPDLHHHNFKAAEYFIGRLIILHFLIIVLLYIWAIFSFIIVLTNAVSKCLFKDLFLDYKSECLEIEL